MASNKIPSKTNVIVGSCFTVFNLFCFLGLPLLAQQNPVWLLTLLIAVITTNTLWALIHEAIHCIFHPNKRINFLFGRLMGLSFGVEFHIARFGHLLHHRFNRTGLDLTDGYDPDKTPRWRTNILYYLQICIGLYLSEIFVPILFLLPKKVFLPLAARLLGAQSPHFKALKNNLLKVQTLRELRVNTIAMLILWTVSFYLYGQYWWALLAASLCRGFLISFADNLPHYGTSTQDTRYAYNLSMPGLLQKLILNFNLHRVHHHYPNVPWSQLPEQLQQTGDHTDINYFKQGMRQWRGVIPIKTLDE